MPPVGAYVQQLVTDDVNEHGYLISTDDDGTGEILERKKRPLLWRRSAYAYVDRAQISMSSITTECWMFEEVSKAGGLPGTF